jgi:hypothetical protein
MREFLKDVERDDGLFHNTRRQADVNVHRARSRFAANPGCVHAARRNDRGHQGTRDRARGPKLCGCLPLLGLDRLGDQPPSRRAAHTA